MDLSGSAIAEHVFNSPEFIVATSKFEQEAQESYKKYGDLDHFNGDVSLDVHHPSYFSPLNDIALTTVIGGYKAFFATVTVQNNALSTYSLFDTFGAGVDDSYKGYIPGLEALYYLQNYGQMPGFTFMPFLWYFLIPGH